MNYPLFLALYQKWERLGRKATLAMSASVWFYFSATMIRDGESLAPSLWTGWLYGLYCFGALQVSVLVVTWVAYRVSQRLDGNHSTSSPTREDPPQVQSRDPEDAPKVKSRSVLLRMVTQLPAPSPPSPFSLAEEENRVESSDHEDPQLEPEPATPEPLKEHTPDAQQSPTAEQMTDPTPDIAEPQPTTDTPSSDQPMDTSTKVQSEPDTAPEEPKTDLVSPPSQPGDKDPESSDLPQADAEESASTRAAARVVQGELFDNLLFPPSAPKRAPKKRPARNQVPPTT